MEIILKSLDFEMLTLQQQLSKPGERQERDPPLKIWLASAAGV